MRHKTRRDIQATSRSRDAVLTALSALQEKSDAYIHREQSLEYVESMINDLMIIAIESEEQFIAYLLSLAREEARAAKSRASWQASAA